jgi:hypothetical protein
MATTRRSTAQQRAATATIVYDEGLRKFLSNIFLTMGIGLAVTGGVAFFVVSSPDLLNLFITKGEKPSLSMLWWVATLIELGLVWWMASRIKDSDMTFGTGMTVFAVYSALNGLTISPVLSLYTAASVTKVFFITSSVFGACALYGHTTKRDITGWGGFLIMGLIALIIVMVVNIFLRSPVIDFVATGAGVLLFMALTAWDMQMFRKMYDEYGNTPSLVINGALALYLDFLNLFLMFLRIFGIKTSD